MQEFDTTSTQSLIDRYYQEEKAQREKEMTLAALTVRLDANDLAMLNVIARRFRKTRDEVAQEVLSNALVDLFARIDGGERKLMARDADDAARAIADEIAEENGVRSVDIKTGVWANHDRQITKLERKKQKQPVQDQSNEEPTEESVAAETAESAQEAQDTQNHSAVSMVSEEEKAPSTSTYSMFAG